GQLANRATENRRAGGGGNESERRQQTDVGRGAAEIEQRDERRPARLARNVSPPIDDRPMETRAGELALRRHDVGEQLVAGDIEQVTLQPLVELELRHKPRNAPPDRFE